MAACRFAGCARPSRAQGLCRGHRHQEYRGRELAPLRDPGSPQSGTCGYDECDDAAVCRGYCRRHYMTAKRTGLLDGVRCTFDGCAEYAVTRGLCPGHYEQHRRGAPLAPINRMSRSLQERLLQRRRVDPVSGCWIWEGSVDGKGYGSIYVGNRKYARTHRVAYELWIGPIGTATVHHKCASPACFNPAHLELATSRENTLEMMERRALHARIAELEAEVAALRQRLA